MQRRALTAMVLALAMSSTAQAVDEPARDTLWYRNTLFARVNPLGLINFLRIGYRHRLEISDTAFGRDTYVFAGLSLVSSPAFQRVGVHAEIEPVALLNFAGSYEFVGYFGTFDQILGFPSTDVDYSDRRLAELGDAGLNQGRIGQVATLSGQFKFKLGPVAVRSNLMATWLDVRLAEGDVVFYEQVFDRLAQDNGWEILNDNDLLGIVGKTRFGVRYTYSAGFYDNPVGPGALPHHRIGPLFAYEFHDDKGRSRWDKPTLFVLAQWWLQHPWRTGVAVNQGIPVIAVGLSFEGDLLWKGKPGGPRGDKARKR